MSHRATNWAFSQNGLKPAAKLVLLCLADRHNNDFGCFPYQATLAADASISRSSLNEQLPPADVQPCPESGHGPGAPRGPDDHDADDAAAGDESCGCDAGSASDPASEPCPDSGHGCDGAVSRFPREPCPDFRHSRVQNLDSLNPGREPGKGTSRAPAREAAPTATVSAAFWTALLAALGLDADDLPPFWRDWPPREHVRRWRDDLGIPEPRIVELARASRARHPVPPDGPRALDQLMADEAARIGRAAKRGRRAEPPAPDPAPKRDIIEMVLSRICVAPSARLSHLALEGQGAFASQC
jgi:hypothetical protein